jgi:serine/threonine protein kinase
LAAPDNFEFSGTDRFEIRRRLGSGTFGVFYEAFDRKNRVSIALKTLRGTDAEALFRLKREFRALAGLSHPNLVELHELLAEGNQWFFTMELIQGPNFLEFVREVLPPPGTAASEDEPTQPIPPRVRVDRLRSALFQAAEGLAALHGARKLHRDVKPSNVLVHHGQRVVLLDFGMVADLDPAELAASRDLVGTPAYMSPEHASCAPLSEASDWYSLGVMLYEALAGRRPYSGNFAQMLARKARFAPPSPGEPSDGVPEDLAKLCLDLLQPDPRRRPGARAILGLLRGRLPAARPAEIAALPAPFVGRRAELAALGRAFEDSIERTVVALLHGSSGIGKSTLVRKFLESTAARGAVTLLGRCYERESVP